jgi:putative glutamine amidotransferase
MPDRSAALPLIGITTDLVELPGGAGGRFRIECGSGYADAVVAAGGGSGGGGMPLLLSPDPALVPRYAALCHGFIFTGGDDPRTEEFAPHHQPTHPAAKPIHPRRQAFEVELLRTLESDFPHKPILGICLGMQLMALLAGGRLHQHLPETCETAARHRREGPAGDRASHPILIDTAAATALGHPWLTSTPTDIVDSHHHQAVADPGSLTIVGHSDDGLIEAIAAPVSERPFYIGVQWHPERTKTRAFGQELFWQLVQAARGPQSI